jgi:diguanylate cyclase (GGDEF)-like protein
MLRRSQGGVLVGFAGVLIVTVLHWQVTPDARLLAWTLGMAIVLVLRLIHVRRMLPKLDRREQFGNCIGVQTLLVTLIGAGWGLSLAILDHGAVDYLFYLRVMILSAALSFTVGALSVFRRMYIAYALGLALPAMIYMGAGSFGADSISMIVVGLVYLGVMLLMSFDTCDRIRRAAMDHLAVVDLTHRLQSALDEEVKLRTAMSLLARVDDLTGISNRRAILETLTNELARCHRFGTPLAVLMIDIDHFKQINDSHGHAAGDIALKQLVQAMGQVVRETDLAGRLGGEEFLIVMPSVERDNALTAAERLRQAVASLEFTIGKSHLAMTISLGVAFFRAGDSVDRLLARADAALYRAKAGGRNRVEIEAAD